MFITIKIGSKRVKHHKKEEIRLGLVGGPNWSFRQLC